MPETSQVEESIKAEQANDNENQQVTVASSDEGGQSGENSSEGSEKPRKRRRRRGGRGRSKGGKKPEGGEATDQGKPDESKDGPPRGKKRSGRRERTEDGEVETAAPLKSNEVFADIPFDELGLRNSVMKGVAEAGFERATFIQAKIIPAVLEGKDVLGQAKTGSGKTAAFGLPLFHLASRGLAFQSIILCPTRELAIQISKDLSLLGKFTPIKVAPVYGGQPIRVQAKKLESGPEIIVATPGRLMDLVERKIMHFDNVRFVVLDEVDRMLDIGFRDDIRKILSRIKTEHQTVFVSATISEEIEQLARKHMSPDVEKLESSGGALTVEMVEQHHLSVQQWDKKRLLAHLLTHEEPALTLVFCRTKKMVDILTDYLKDKGIDAHAIHGDMHQSKRDRVMTKLRKGQLAVLVASDLAARGLDVDDISHVINFDLPEDPEIYIHRIGRTARAGRAGIAWSIVTPEEGKLLTNVEKLANIEIPKMEYADFETSPPPERVRREEERKAAAQLEGPSLGRYGQKELPAAAGSKVDEHRFPGGLVPTKHPPKRIGGKVSSGRGG